MFCRVAVARDAAADRRSPSGFEATTASGARTRPAGRRSRDRRPGASAANTAGGRPSGRHGRKRRKTRKTRGGPEIGPAEIEERALRGTAAALGGYGRATAGGRRLLIVDDDAEFRTLLGEQLAQSGEFETTACETGEAALAHVADSYFDAILLDVTLPDMDGREVCRLMRRAGVKVPIILVAASSADADVILGLDAGANDYVAKPFRLGVLLARLRAQLRQHAQSDDAIFVIGPYTFQPRSKVLIDGRSRRTIRLTETETAILKYLYRAGGAVVDRETLLHEVWGYNQSSTTHTLETHVYRLRRKIEPDPGRARYLLTVPGGYRLAI